MVVAGDRQTGPSGGSPPLPLRVLVTGSDGRAFAGATVTWQVVSGGGSVSPTSTPTDAAGEAATVATLGLPGTMQVRAAVGGLTPATFQLTSIDPCRYLAPFRTDTSVTGALTAADCDLGDGTRVDFYDLQPLGQRTLEITMHAASPAELDAFLWLWDFSGPIVALDDDGGGATDARIKVILKAGRHVVGANSYGVGELGAYTVASSVIPTTVTGCEDVWLTGSVTFTEAVTTGDCDAPVAGGTFYSDQFLIVLFTGQTVTITESSGAVDPYLSLFRSTGELVAEDDTSGGGTAARITFTAPATDIYVVDAGTALTDQTGSYSLALSPIVRAPPVEGFGPRPGSPGGFLAPEIAPDQRPDVVRPRLRRPLRRP
ncbi:MAG TPA: Ig-like domain-containing protein [Gemmatimonadales bacterium]|nr:Ig-like domain-containing protein [Gemmatimonadales bacterium]